MTDILLKISVCLLAASLLMVFHESVKVLVYRLCKKGSFSGKISPWKFWRYIDPVGLILAVVCSVPVSKPYFFRIREQKTNLMLGITGLLSLLAVFTGSVLVLQYYYGGMAGLDRIVIDHWYEQIIPMFVQYMALLSFGMLAANLFPVSTFDMGLLVAGISAPSYLKIIKADGAVKMILMLALLLDVIRYGGIRLLQIIL